MKNSFYFSVRAAFFSCTILFFASCSEEPFPETAVDSTAVASFTSLDYGCSSSDPFGFSYSDFITAGNGSQTKTLVAKVSNTDTHLLVEASYVATAENHELPGKISIDIGGSLFEFSDVILEKQ